LYKAKIDDFGLVRGGVTGEAETAK
jgi:hypothetical protein